MAPEIWGGDVEYEDLPQADVWSFCATIVQVLTNQYLFHGENVMVVMNLVRNEISVQKTLEAFVKCGKLSKNQCKALKNLSKKCFIVDAHSRPNIENVLKMLKIIPIKRKHRGL